MYAHVVSLGVTGLDGYPVTVETHISGGLPKFAMVGLPDSAVKESSERVRSAIKNLICLPFQTILLYTLFTTLRPFLVKMRLIE